MCSKFFIVNYSRSARNGEPIKNADNGGADANANKFIVYKWELTTLVLFKSLSEVQRGSVEVDELLVKINIMISAVPQCLLRFTEKGNINGLIESIDAEVIEELTQN